jgi:hypothetical protein
MVRVYNEGNPGHIIRFLCVENPHRWAMELEWKRYGFKGSRSDKRHADASSTSIRPKMDVLFSSLERPKGGGRLMKYRKGYQCFGSG